MSISGSLVSYTVQQQGQEMYTATLKKQSINSPAQIPEEIKIIKSPEGWDSDPAAEEIVSNLIKCIENGTPQSIIESRE